jgi:hypothetical protein
MMVVVDLESSDEERKRTGSTVMSRLVLYTFRFFGLGADCQNRAVET